MTPRLSDHLVMGLARDEFRTRRLIEFHRHIYLCDLTNVRLVALDLREKVFYGCVFSASTLEGADTRGTEFESCLFVQEHEREVTEAEATSELNLVELALATLSVDQEKATASAQQYCELLMDIVQSDATRAAVGIHANFLCTIIHPRMPQPNLDEIITYLPVSSYRELVQYLAHRINNGDIVEKEQIVSFLAETSLDIGCIVAHPTVPNLLRLPSEVVIQKTVELLLRHCDKMDSLAQLLRHDGDEVARKLLTFTALHPCDPSFILFSRHADLIPRDVAVALLRNENEDIRHSALWSLWLNACWSPSSSFLRTYDPTEKERLKLLGWEAQTRSDQGQFFVGLHKIISTLLGAGGGEARAKALRLVGFSGDPAFEVDARRALSDDDDEARMYAVRALRWMSHVERDDPEILALKTDASDRVREEVLAFVASTPPPSPPVKEPEPEPGFPLAIVDEAKLDMLALIETLRDGAGLRLDDATTVARELRLTGSALLDVEADEIEAVAAAIAKYGVALADVPQP